MSYSSISYLSTRTTLKQVQEVISLLGFIKVECDSIAPDRVDSRMWSETKDYQSWCGVELDIYKKCGEISVTTRSRAGRSYWDLVHQNKTLKLLKDLFGGYFETDAGRNRYWHPDEKPPTPISSGCYLARWEFDNGLLKPRIYLARRATSENNTNSEITGNQLLDSLNPVLFSNNLLLPYVIAIWEEYFKSTFAVLLKYSENREAVLRRAKLHQSQLESIAAGRRGVEEALAESFSFQRPSNIVSNFKLIDPKLDLATPMRKPYRRRKTSLYESINDLVDQRNEFVHTGNMSIKLDGKSLDKNFRDMETAIDRAYQYIGKFYKFTPITDY